MWGSLLLLAMASYTLAVPAPQQDSGNLAKLIENVFGNGPTDNQNANLNKPATTPTTILGSQNTPKPRPEDCECVPYFQCQNGTILDNGVGIIDIRLSGPCDNYLSVCCTPPNKIKPGDRLRPPATPRTGCGQRHPQGVGFRITGDQDNEAQFGEFPWMVAILKDEILAENGNKLNVFQCGGSLIHKQAVLTAAHCVQGQSPSQLKIRAGEWDTQTNVENYPHQDRGVRQVVVHEQYNSGALFYDFAILILSEPVEEAENVDIVCLPDKNVIFDKSRCTASGWGKDKFGKEGQYQVILKKIELPVVPHDICQDSLRNTRLGKHFKLHDSFICAGGEPGKDTCRGDGGSPLVCPSKSDPSRYLQAGIVAWGIGCGDDGTPGVYANVAYVRDWIDEQMAFYNLDNTVYQLTHSE